jgi:hypothetical protein
MASNFFDFTQAPTQSFDSGQNSVYVDPAAQRTSAAQWLYPQLQQMGYSGPAITDTSTGSGQDLQQSSDVSPQLQSWLKNKGYNLQYGSGGKGYAAQLTDSSGKPVAQYSEPTGATQDLLSAAALVAGGYFGGSALANAVGGAGAATGAGAAAGTGGGLSSSDLAALYGNAGYGAGMSGLQTAAYDTALGSGIGTLPGAMTPVSGISPLSAVDTTPIAAAPSLPGAASSVDASLLNSGIGATAAGTAAKNLTPAAIDSGLNTPGYGANASANDVFGSSGANAAGSLGDSSLLSQLGTFAKNNPQLASQLMGLTAGGIAKLFQGNSSSQQAAPSAAASQASLTANKPAAYQRTYTPPPANYRPGFDPEWNYFGGIGGLGTGH